MNKFPLVALAPGLLDNCHTRRGVGERVTINQRHPYLRREKGKIVCFTAFLGGRRHGPLAGYNKRRDDIESS